MIGKTISHYRITEKLGEGGMGEVFLAEDTHLHCNRALKFLPVTVTPDSPNHVRLVNEARALAALEHHNICPVQEIGEHNGQTFIVMSYLEGRTLKDRMAEGSVPLDEALEISRQISAGLAAAHAKGIVHRDVKPDNVMLTEANGETQGPLRAVLMDFGIAKNRESTMATRTGTIMGTMAYMSPEQAQGIKVDAATDAWAVGVLLYEMLSGQRPFPGESEPALLYAIVNTDPEPLTGGSQEIPESVERVIGKALAKDRGNRYTDAAELLVDLDRAVAGEAVKGRRLERRRRGPIAGAAGAVIGLVIVALFVWPGFLATTDAISVLAVLPLANLSGDSDEDYFADGFTGELIAGLTQVQGFNVIARGSVLDFRNSDLSVNQMAEKLGVDKVVTGTVQQEGKSLRVTIEIIDIAKGLAVWANTFNGSDEEVLQLQGSMARSIVEVLKGGVTEREEQLFSGVAKIDPEAYRAYLKGIALAETWGLDEIWHEALGYFQEAVIIEPEFAPAYAAQSRIYNFLGWFAPEEGYPSMCEEAARKALELDPDLPEANAALAHYLYLYEHRWDEAQVLFTKAMELDPGNVHVLLAFAPFLWMSGQCDEGIRIFQKAADLDPLNIAPSQGVANALCNCGKFEECIRLSTELLERFQSEITLLEYFMALSYAGLGQMEEAMAAAEIAKTSQSGMANVYWLAGRKDEAWDLVGGRDGNDPSHIQMRAALLILEGDLDQAIDLFEQGLKAYPALTQFFILTYSVQEPMRDVPRFQELMRSMNVPGY